jgi:drug/metabolite transporter (DMT)-like permease
MSLPQAPAASPAAISAANRRSIVTMAIAMAFFIANDALVKYVSQTLAGAQLIFIRGIVSSVLLLAAAHAMGATRQLGLLLNRPLLARSALDAIATLVYLTALFHLPLGNATAINLATPLFITLLAVFALGERVGPARWLAIGLGFAGVLLVVQPRAEGFNAWALLCVAGTVLHAVRDTSTCYIPARVPSILITVATALAVSLLSGAVSLVQGWKPVGGTDLTLLAVAAAFLGVGYYLLIISMRQGEMSVVAPFRYTGLLYALVLGYIVWGDVPTRVRQQMTQVLDFIGSRFKTCPYNRLSCRSALGCLTFKALSTSFCSGLRDDTPDSGVWPLRLTR